MSETVNVVIAGTPTPIVLFDSNTAEAIRLSGLNADAAEAASTAAQAAEAAAEAARDLVLAGNPPLFANTTAGIAGTSADDYFLVIGSGGTFASLWKNVAGVATDQNLALASTGLFLGYAGLYPSLEDAITAAGVGGTVDLVQGATYTRDRNLETLAGQTIRGNGATFVRANQVVTTTTTAITSGATTSVTVTSAAGFAIGQQVAFAQQGVARSALVIASTLSDTRTITNIVGNVLTLNAAPNANISIGGTCFLTFQQLILGEGAKVEGLTFDGNRSNWSYSRWEVTAEVGTSTGAHNQTIRDNKFVDVPGEAILPYGDSLKVIDNDFVNIGGNGVHLSGVNTAIISGNTAANGNIDIDVSHGDGFVSFSNGNTNIVITSNVADAFISGVGAINDTDSDVTVNDNDFTNMYCFGVEVGGTASSITITNNRIKGVGATPSKKTGLPYYGGICLTGMTGDTYGISGNQVEDVDSSALALAVSATTGTNFSIIGNSKLEGRVEFAGIEDFEVASNKMTGRLNMADLTNGKIHHNRISIAVDGGFAARFGASTAYQDVEFTDNTIVGDSYGFDFSASATSYKGIHFDRNRFYNQTNRGLNFPAFAGTFEDVSINGNKFRTGPASPVDYIGIVLGANFVTGIGNEFHNGLIASSRIAVLGGPTPMGDTVLINTVVRGNWLNTIELTNNSGIKVIGSILDGEDVTNQTGNTISGSVVL